jgi:CheY-like chemotaxis protein
MTPSSPTHKALILVVEDEELLRCNQTLFLLDMGFQVIEAPTGDEALRLFNAGADVDLVITDINMPGRMNGDALAAWLVRQKPALPVILTSAVTRQHSLRCSHHRFIPKPYALADMERLIKQLLH